MSWKMLGQKAPSAKRCIKTIGLQAEQDVTLIRQKAPSAKRCIKTGIGLPLPPVGAGGSESTERQKVH